MLFNTLTVLSASFVALISARAVPRQTTVTHSTPDYYLQSSVTAGNASYGGMYVQGFHTGAGLSATVLTANKTAGILGYLSTDYQYFEESLPFSFTLENSSSSSEGPTGYNYVAINAGQGTPGFSIHPEVDVLQFTGLSNFGSFAACYVPGIPPYQSVGSEIQVFWRPTSVAADPACADIIFYVVFNSTTTA